MGRVGNNDDDPQRGPRPPAQVKLQTGGVPGVLRGYGRQLGTDTGFGETGVRLALVGIETMIVENKATLQEVIVSRVFPDIVNTLVRKCSDETKLTSLRTILSFWGKADLVEKNYITDNLGDFVVESLVCKGGEIGALARQLLVSISDYFVNKRS